VIHLLIKRILLFILLSLFLLPIAAHAATDDDGQLYLITHLTNIINFLSSLLCLIASLILIYGGFIYVTHANQEEVVERSKFQMINGGIGLFISFAIVGISKLIILMSDSKTPESNGFSPIMFRLTAVVVAVFSGYLIYRKLKGRKQSIKEEQVENFHTKLSIPSEELHTFLLLLCEKKYSFQSGLTNIRGDIDEWHAEYSTDQNSMLLSVYFQERPILSSTVVKSISTQHHTFSENVSLEGEAIPLSSLLLLIHQSFLEQYLQQHHRIEDWVTMKTPSISSDKVFKSLCQLGHQHQQLLAYVSQCTPEQKHFLENSFFRDLEQMIDAFNGLSPTKQHEYEPGLLKRITSLSQQLLSIQETIDMHIERDVAFAFRVIDEKYKAN